MFREGGEEAGSAAISDVALANREKLTEKEKQAGSSGVAEPSNRCHREESPNPRPVYLTSSRDGREQRATGSARTTRSGQVFLQTSGFPSFPIISAAQTHSPSRGCTAHSRQARGTDAIRCVNTRVIKLRLQSPLSGTGKAGPTTFALPGHRFLSKIQKATLAKVRVPVREQRTAVRSPWMSPPASRPNGSSTAVAMAWGWYCSGTGRSSLTPARPGLKPQAQ